MKTRIKIFLVTAAILSQSVLLAQVTFKNSPGKSQVTVKGTSTLHDWEMITKDFNVEAGFVVGTSDLKINSTSFHGKVTGLKSDHDLMNEKAYDALKSEKFPEIKFYQSEMSASQLKGSSFSGKIKGRIEIAGAGKVIMIPYNGIMKSNQVVNVSGSFSLKMSEFGIKPPTAIMGTIKTGDDLTLDYNFELKSDKPLTLNK